MSSPVPFEWFDGIRFRLAGYGAKRENIVHPVERRIVWGDIELR
jgi:hypothetical protein